MVSLHLLPLHSINTNQDFFSGIFPKMLDFKKNTIDKCRKQGYLATEAGRRRIFPHITNSDEKIRQHSERQAVNFLIQGMSSKILKAKCGINGCLI